MRGARAPGRADRVGPALVAPSSRRTVSDCPGGKANRSASPGGTSKVTATESSVSGSTRATRELVELGPAASDRLHVLERLAAASRSGTAPCTRSRRTPAVCVVSAEPQRGQATGSRRVSARVQRDRTRAEPARRAAGRCRPPTACGGPSAVIQSVLQAGASAVRTSTSAKPAAAQPAPQVVGDLAQRGAARVGRRDRHDQALALGRDVAQDAQVGHGQHGQLRVGHRRRDRAGRGEPGRCHHVASGWARATLCSSASSVAERLGVHAVPPDLPATRASGAPCGRSRRGCAEHGVEHRVDLGPQRPPGRPPPRAAGPPPGRLEQLVDQRPDDVERGLPSCSCDSAVPSPSRITHWAA